MTQDRGRLVNAMKAHDFTTARALIEGGMDPNIKTEGYGSMLSIAAAKGDADMVRFMISKGARHSSAVSDGKTALYYAINGGNMEVVQILINAGANPNAITSDGKTIMEHALLTNRTIAEYLINKADKTELLEKAIREDNENLMMFILVHNTTKNRLGKLSKERMIDVLLADDLLRSTLFMKFGGNINELNDMGKSALHIAVEQKKVGAVNMILDIGGNINIKSAKGAVLLFFATVAGDIDMVNLLLRRKANPNIATNSGETAFGVAAHKNKHELMEILAAAGADPNRGEPNNMSPLAYAAQSDSVGTVKKLLELGASTEPYPGETPAIIKAASGANFESFKLLIEAGANTNSTDSNGNTALKLIIDFKITRDWSCDRNVCALMPNAHKEAGKYEMIRILIERSTNINAANRNGDTALSDAVLANDIRAARMLLASGASADIGNNENVTPFLVACRSGHIEMIDLLVEYGVNVNARIASGENGVYLAVLKGDINMIRKLTALGVSAVIPNNDGVTPLKVIEKYIELNLNVGLNKAIHGVLKRRGA